MKISIVIPVYNGSKTIGPLVEEIDLALSRSYSLEILLINDGSPDNSADVCRGLVTRYPGVVKFINLTKNFGEHAAVMAGLNYATGEYTVIMDDDFQNPPSEIVKMVKKIEEGYDVVYSKYKTRRYSLFRVIGSKFNDVVANVSLGKPKGLYLSSFKIMNASIRKRVIEYKEPFPYVDGIILACTARIGSVYVEHGERREGRSSYNFMRLCKLFADANISFLTRDKSPQFVIREKGGFEK